MKIDSGSSPYAVRRAGRGLGQLDWLAPGRLIACGVGAGPRAAPVHRAVLQEVWACLSSQRKPNRWDSHETVAATVISPDPATR
jgi:hypothetical protein